MIRNASRGNSGKEPWGLERTGELLLGLWFGNPVPLAVAGVKTGFRGNSVLRCALSTGLAESILSEPAGLELFPAYTFPVIGRAPMGFRDIGGLDGSEVFSLR